MTATRRLIISSVLGSAALLIGTATTVRAIITCLLFAIACLLIYGAQAELVKRAIQSEEKFRLAVDFAPVMFWTAEASGKNNFFNQTFYDYTGTTPEEALAPAGWLHLIHDEDIPRILEQTRISLGNTTPFKIEMRIRRASDGVYRWNLNQAIPLRDSNGEVFLWLGTTTDIHEQKQTLEMLEIERTLRDQFVNTLSHDLKNPLATASFSAQLLLKGAVDRVPALSRQILTSLKRVDTMITDLLDVSRVRAGNKLPMEFATCDAASLVRTTVREFAAIHGERFRDEVPDSLTVLWSEQQIRRVLENLISNAVKYGQDHGLITVGLKSVEDEQVEIWVHNLGNPLSMEDQNRLFLPYVQLASSNSGKRRGWGLGLSLVQGVVDAHRGKVWVESSEASGTTFHIRVPRILKG